MPDIPADRDVKHFWLLARQSTGASPRIPPRHDNGALHNEPCRTQKVGIPAQSSSHRDASGVARSRQVTPSQKITAVAGQQGKAAPDHWHTARGPDASSLLSKSLAAEQDKDRDKQRDHSHGKLPT